MEYKEEKVAGSMMVSATCNLNCEYCYIGKNDSLGSIDKEIIKEFEEKGVTNLLKDAYDKGLERLGLWGSETTLYLEYFNDEIFEILEYFDKLGHIFISSNFYDKKGVQKLVNLISEINSNLDDRSFEIRVQTSIDGDPRINDETRKTLSGKGSTDNILENLEFLVKEVSKMNLKDNFVIKHSFKSTLNIYRMKTLVNNDEYFLNYFRFFDSLGDIFTSFNLPDNFKWSLESGHPTLVSPGNSDVEGGKLYALYIKKIRELIIKNEDENTFKYLKIKFLLPYIGRLKEVEKEFVISREQNRAFACSASGRGYSLGVNGESHLCHRTYLHNHKNYKDLLAQTMSSYKQGRYERFVDYFIVDKDNSEEFARQMYGINSYRDFAQLRFNNIYSNLKILAMSGQAHYKYLDDEELSKLTTKFLMKVANCVVENFMETGTFHAIPMQQIKIWANGAVQELIESYNELKDRGIL